MLQVKNVTKYYRDGTKAVPIFKHLTARLAEGNFTAVAGPSGVGKSTLLRIINKLEPIDSGSLTLFGKGDDEYSVREWRQLIGFAFQQSIMLEGTVKDNVMAGPRLHNLPFTDEQCVRLMREVELEENLLHKQAKALSGGQQQRVSLIRALALKPKLLLLDEVTASLDDSNKRTVEQCLLKRNREENLTVLWVTHDMGQLKRVAQNCWFVSEGTVSEYDSVDEVLDLLRHQVMEEG